MLGTAKLAAFVATKNAEKAREFYENKLGLTFVSDEFYALVFDANGTMLRVQKVQEFEPHQFTALGWHVADIRAAIEELSAKGVVFEKFPGLPQDELGIATFGEAQVAWFKDPDGNILSLDQM